MAMSEALPCCSATVLQVRAWLRKGSVSSNCLFYIYCTFLHIFHVLTVSYSHNTFTISQICVSAWINYTDFTNLGWFSWLHWHCIFEVELIWFHWFPSIILMVEKSGWIRNDNKVCCGNSKSPTTHNMASARLVGVVCTVCGKRFANRWAYNQHRTNRYLEGTNCYSVQRKQSEMIAIRRGNVSTAVLRSTGALRSGRRKSDAKYGLTCIYIDSSSYFAFFGIFMQNMTNTPWYPRGYQGELNMQLFAYVAFFVFLN